MVKTSIRSSEGTERGYSVTIDLGLLTGNKRASPIANVLVNARSSIALSDQMLSSSSTRMGDRMKIIKNGTAKRLRNIRARITSRSIAENGTRRKG